MDDDFYKRISFLHTEEDKRLFICCGIYPGIDENWTKVSQKIAQHCTNIYEEIEPFCFNIANNYPEKIIGNSAYEDLKKRTFLSGTTPNYYNAIAMIITDMYCIEKGIPIPSSNKSEK